MIDFTNLPVRNKTYAGANGSKISVLYNNELYMLKFPAVPVINKDMSYANGCVSEYLGCHIFESIGIPVQKTMLRERKERILDFSYQKLRKRERSKNRERNKNTILADFREF